MKLSCIRCKTKKLRCNREEPCDRCLSAGAVCATAERKARVSAKGKVGGDREVIGVLNARIEVLERALKGAEVPGVGEVEVDNSSLGRTPGRSPSTTAKGSGDSVEDLQRRGSAEGGVRKVGDEWLDKQFRSAKDFSVSHLNDQLVKDSPVTEAISAIDGALTDLGEVHEVISDHPEAVLTKEQSRNAVQVALELMRGEFFTSLLELDFMMSLADVICSPHVQIDPAARLVYYSLVFHGAVVGESQSSSSRVTARALYLQCLQAVPAWQEAATGTTMDMIAASVMTWTSVLSFDYNLAWRFHRQACQFAKQMGLQHLDVMSSKGTKEAAIQQNQRVGFWNLVLCDLFFRFCYDRESSISADASPRFVNVPDIMDVTRAQPMAGQTMAQIVWGRAIFLAKSFYESWDQVSSSEEALAGKEFQERVDTICDEIEDIVQDWHLVKMMEAQNGHPLKSWVYADTIVGVLNIVLQMERLRHGSNVNTVTPRSLRVARLVLDATVRFEELTNKSKVHGSLYMYCIAFYPYRAFFMLYYHILQSDDPADYKDDILRLERIGAVMAKAARVRFEYVPIAKAIASLNQVAKHIQQSKTSKSPAKQWNNWPPTTPDSLDQRLMADSVTRQLQQGQGTTPDMMMDFQQDDTMQWLPRFGDVPFTGPVDFQQAVAQPDFQPVEYMQQVEHQFQGGNWYNGWWDANGGASLP